MLAHEGRKPLDIVADLGIRRRTVQRWPNADCARGLVGFTPREARGKDYGLPASMTDEVKRWVMEGPTEQGLGLANWTCEALAAHLKRAHGLDTSRSGLHRFCATFGIRPERPTYRSLRGDPGKQAGANHDLGGLLVPTRKATLGVKGHRPVVGTRDGKDVLYVLAVLHLLTGAVHSNSRESLQAAIRKGNESKTRRMQRVFADHLRHVGRVSPRRRSDGWC